MTREEIEKAAFDSIDAPCERDCEICTDNHKEHCTWSYIRDGFVMGAKWRIKKVWHDVSKRPDENEPTIIEFGNNKFSFHEKGYKGPWKYNVEQFGFKRWAYVKDLMPEE